jgi:5-methylcytosine-specific restriction endonuclease McrA
VSEPRQAAPSHRRIAIHWIGRVLPGTDRRTRLMDVGEPCCFACGWWHAACPDGCTHGLERAHVVPHSKGGSDTDPTNFALLCETCHHDAPSTTDAEWFWHWVAMDRPSRDPMVTTNEKIVAAVEDALPLLTPDDLAGLAALSPDDMQQHMREVHERIGFTAHAGTIAPATAARAVVELATLLRTL